MLMASPRTDVIVTTSSSLALMPISPAFGAGCCSPLFNSDRTRVEASTAAAKAAARRERSMARTVRIFG